jgi:hypothetical protein
MNIPDLEAFDPVNLTAQLHNSRIDVVRSRPFPQATDDAGAVEKFENLTTVQNPKLKVWYEPGIDEW